MEVANKFGMVSPKQSTTQAERAVFFIDLEGIIRIVMYYPQSLGRNFEEIKRVIQGSQKTDKGGSATSDNWKPGDDVIMPTSGSCGLLKKE